MNLMGYLQVLAFLRAIPRCLAGIALLALLLMTPGCATQDGAPQSYSTFHQPERPSGDLPGQRVVASEEAENRLTVPVPGGPSAEDLAVGEKIRELLMEDKSLAPAPSNVITIVSKGVVKMKGYVRSRRAAYELHQRIAGIPGVQSVENELTLWNGRKL